MNLCTNARPAAHLLSTNVQIGSAFPGHSTVTLKMTVVMDLMNLTVVRTGAFLTELQS